MAEDMSVAAAVAIADFGVHLLGSTPADI